MSAMKLELIVEDSLVGYWQGAAGILFDNEHELTWSQRETGPVFARARTLDLLAHWALQKKEILEIEKK